MTFDDEAEETRAKFRELFQGIVYRLQTEPEFAARWRERTAELRREAEEGKRALAALRKATPAEAEAMIANAISTLRKE